MQVSKYVNILKYLSIFLRGFIKSLTFATDEYVE